MKLRILTSAVICVAAVFSLSAQNEDAFEAYKAQHTQRFDNYKQEREAEYQKFKQQYYAAFEKYKEAYQRYLEGEMDVLDLMASDDGVKITPLAANVPVPKAVSTVREEKSRIKRDMEGVKKMKPEEMIALLSSAKDTVDQMKEAAVKMEQIVENVSMPVAVEKQKAQVEPVKEVKDVVLEAMDEDYLAALMKNTANAVVDAVSSVTDRIAESAASTSTVSDVPSGKPTAYTRISSPFGTRVHPITRKTHTHKGVDMAASRMTAIYATADGEVTYAKYNGGYGNFVKVNHRNGYKTAYAHMHQIVVVKGQSVKKGDLIGYVGSTGRSTGNHLHYEVYYQDTLIDPATTL